MCIWSILLKPECMHPAEHLTWLSAACSSALWSGILDGGCLEAEIFNSLTRSLAQCDSCQTL